MKNDAGQYIYSVLRQAFQEFKIIANKSLAFLKRTPLPNILVWCIALALLITIIPLVISLFVIVVLIKLMMLLLSNDTKKSHPDDVEIIYPRKRIDE